MLCQVKEIRRESFSKSKEWSNLVSRINSNNSKSLSSSYKDKDQTTNYITNNLFNNKEILNKILPEINPNLTIWAIYLRRDNLNKAKTLIKSQTHQIFPVQVRIWETVITKKVIISNNSNSKVTK